MIKNNVYEFPIEVPKEALGIEHIGKEIEVLLGKHYEEFNNDQTWRICLNCIDLTTLNVEDTEGKVGSMIEKVNGFKSIFSDLPNVASICVYPSFVEVCRSKIREAVNIASVAGGFPASQTLVDIKLAEVRECILRGADEVDVVISVGKFIERRYGEVYSEIKAIKEVVGKRVLKVILETGVLGDPSLIYSASILAMDAGADFIKTSTGKVAINATPVASYVMCKAIRDWYDRTGVRIGYKAAGGISTTQQAVEHYIIAQKILGNEWMNNRYFRFGASRLANNLLSSLKGDETKYF